VKTEIVKITQLKPHPRNYNDHPDDQVEHIAKSLEQHGQYRPIVIANDDTILAGHGVVLGAQKIEWETIVCYRVDLAPDAPQALKILTADNELSHFSMKDDRALTEILKELREFDEFGLYGTGFDDMKLANLIMVTRPASEIENHDAAAEWIGMPDYVPKPDQRKYIIVFPDDEQRERFAKANDLPIGKTGSSAWSTNWPPKEREDLVSVRYEDD
jgi:hypothetical protein